MQYEEKQQKMLERRILHLLHMEKIKKEIDEETKRKQELVKEQKEIMDKMEDLIKTKERFLDDH